MIANTQLQDLEIMTDTTVTKHTTNQQTRSSFIADEENDVNSKYNKKYLHLYARYMRN